MIQITIQVDGMMCGMCESHVNDAVRNACKVKKVMSSHKQGQTVVIAEGDISDGTLRTVIEKAGYTAGEITRTPYEKKGLFGFLKK